MIQLHSVVKYSQESKLYNEGLLMKWVLWFKCFQLVIQELSC